MELLGECSLKSSWELFMFIMGLQLSLSIFTLLPHQVGLIILGLGFQCAILRFLVVPWLGLSRPTCLSGDYELAKGQASVFLRLHRLIMGGAYLRGSQGIMRNYFCYKSSGLTINLAMITMGIPRNGGSGKSRRQLRNAQKRGPPPTPTRIAQYSKYSVRSLIKADMSEERLSYMDFDLTRYGSTTHHLYKERKHILFKFLPND